MDGRQKRLLGSLWGNANHERFLGVDFVQERFLGQGPQDNESAIEQAKDEQISDFSESLQSVLIRMCKLTIATLIVRSKYKSTTGTDMPIKDKPNQLDRFGGR